MSRAIPLPESRTLDTLDEEDDDQIIAEEIRQNLPSWLTSLVFHLVLVLLLALFTVAGNSSLGGGGIGLDVTTGGGDPLGSADGELEAALELPSALTMPQTTETVPAAEFTETLTDVADIALVDVQNVAAASAGGEAVLGQPGGSGDGVGGSDEGGDGMVGRFPITTGVFGNVAEGTRFVYVFDHSDSMNSTFSYQSEGKTVFSITPLAAAKAELLRSLGDLDERQQFHMVFYNQDVWPFDPNNLGYTSNPSHGKLIPANAKNRDLATRFVNDMYGSGQTNHMPALEIAIRLKPDVIFLMTDGEEKDDPSRDQLKRLRNLNKKHAKINVVQFCYQARSGGTLVQLANENGGKHIFMTIAQLGPGMNGATDAPKFDSARKGSPKGKSKKKPAPSAADDSTGAPTDADPADADPAGPAPSDLDSTDSPITAAEFTPVDTTPADTTPADTTPADTAPADTAPADSDPSAEP
jgi:hypothetical protein